MTPKKGEYYYHYYKGGYAIFKCTSSENGNYAGEKVWEEKVYHDPKQAKKRVYELNGWEYKNK